MGIAKAFILQITAISIGCVAILSNRIGESEEGQTHIMPNQVEYSPDPILTLEKGERILSFDEKTEDLLAPSHTNTDIGRNYTSEELESYKKNDLMVGTTKKIAEFNYEEIYEKDSDKIIRKRKLRYTCQSNPKRVIEKTLISEITLDDEEKVITRSYGEFKEIIRKVQNESIESNFYLNELDSVYKAAPKERCKAKDTSISSSSGLSSFNDEEIYSKSPSPINLEHFDEDDVLYEHSPLYSTPSNSFSYDAKSGKFIINIDEKILEDFNEKVSLKDLDMKNESNVFMGNLCFSFLIDLLNKKNVFLKQFVGECRSLEETLNLSLYNKNREMSLSSYIQKKFEQLQEESPKFYRLNDNVFQYTQIKDVIQGEADITEHSRGIKNLRIRNYIKQYMSIRIVPTMGLEGDISLLRYSEKKITSIIINFTKRCYLDLINYILRSIINENNRVNDEIYQKQVKRLF